MNQTANSLKAIQPQNRWDGFHPISRRVGYGSTAWATKTNLIQPQDGSADGHDTAAKVTDIGTRMQLAAIGGVALVEPEDARLTGGTRSLVRRMLGLNIAPRVSGIAVPKTGKPAKRAVAAANRTQVA